MELRQLTCTHCGKQIEIPAELEEFSCLYCGQKMTAAEFFVPPESAAECAADLAFVREHLVECVSSYMDYQKYFNRKDYETYFLIYKRGCTEIFEAMDRCVRCELTHRDARLAEFATLFLDEREQYLQKNPHWKHRNAREHLLFDSKLVLAWFTVPAILEMDITIGADYVRELHRQYMLRYPNNAFYPGTYGEIAAGFKKKKYFFF